VNRQSTSDVCSINRCPCVNFREDKRERTKKKKQSFFGMLLGGGADFDAPCRLCTCGHKKDAHRPGIIQGADCKFPTYWRNQLEIPITRDYYGFQDLVPVSADVLGSLQKLLNATYVNRWTRDRKKHQDGPVPKGFRIEGALRNERQKTWLSYNYRRSIMIADRDERAKDGGASDPKLDQQFDVKSNEWQNITSDGAERMDKDINEWYLFHGCREWVAKRICETDFHIGSAGKNTGTLYGGGTYFAESVTKADEYSKPTIGWSPELNKIAEERDLFCILLCRCLGGRVRYSDEVTPNPEECTKACIEGPYDSVLGDREKCRGTYREFVFFDSDDMYPEYIVYYSRIF